MREAATHVTEGLLTLTTPHPTVDRKPTTGSGHWARGGPNGRSYRETPGGDHLGRSGAPSHRHSRRPLDLRRSANGDVGRQDTSLDSSE